MVISTDVRINFLPVTRRKDAWVFLIELFPLQYTEIEIAIYNLVIGITGSCFIIVDMRQLCRNLILRTLMYKETHCRLRTLHEMISF